MDKLTEGMRPGDLEDLVLPMISVDEYESKLDDDAIVIGFYVSDRDAAEDLNRFIQKSPTQLLDTEVSPAPDQHGYYLVFVELLNDIRIVDNLKDIIEEVSPLTGTDEWQMRLRGAEDGVMKFSPKVLNHRFTELRKENVDGGDDSAEPVDETESHIMEFLTPSDLLNAVVENNKVTLTGSGGKFFAEVVGLGDADELLSTHGLTESAVSLGLNDIAKTIQLTRLLGEGWYSSYLGEHTILQYQGSETVLLLRNARFI